MNYRVESSLDSGFYTFVNDLTDMKQMSRILDNAYLDGWCEGEYGYHLSKDSMFSNNVACLIHTDINSDIKNIIISILNDEMYSPSDHLTEFNVKNNIGYWMDVLVKSGDITGYSTDVVLSESDNSITVTVEYSLADDTTTTFCVCGYCNAFSDVEVS